MIFPPSAVLGKVEEEERQTSRTYRLDLENNRITGMIDGLDAVRQTVFMIMSTERFAYFIYSENYGMERRSVGGFSLELQRWISEALLQDDRITGIEDFETTIRGDQADVSFTVVSIFGRFAERRTFASV
ncbi:DUF2634 domain-containing protein [Paenibacillus naphthalenovorans]|uniref:DUF2634 domain-containing protein n=1 Tax=Paenibacillus naphthalenovorans TaxID=162209 RepID=UPI00088532AF|nr:DUF2634 domain-containing protein [Paenibacillus naphthalenovorans]SDJ92888.1 Protein of unknown function [Paenibacillus naphthalenovorans]